MDDDDAQFAVSYQGVTPGVPVLTKDGQQFGVLEHVLEVPRRTSSTGSWCGRAAAAGWTGGSSYIRCDLDAAQATALPPPARDTPVYYANAIDQATGAGYEYHQTYGSLFRRAHWRQES